MRTVLSIAFPFAPVGPHAVGGAERILTEMDQAMVTTGMRSLVVACEGSLTTGELYDFPLPSVQSLDGAAKAWCTHKCEAAIHRALRSNEVDLIHMHNMDFWQYRLPPELPVLVTLHLPIEWYRPEIWTSVARFQFCCVSQSQRRVLRPALECSVVENGVALPEMRDVPREEFALVIGRICPEKNAHEALEAGTIAGIPVVLAGQVFPYPEHQQYMREKIEPLLTRSTNGIQHSYIGPASTDEVRSLLARARCLLHPTLAPETSSLVAMEALAMGTPVIAYPSGALPEILDHGKTGFLVQGVAEMAEYIEKIGSISHQACRAEAEQRFSVDRMVQDYFRLYERSVTRSRKLRQAEARSYA